MAEAETPTNPEDIPRRRPHQQNMRPPYSGRGRGRGRSDPHVMKALHNFGVRDLREFLDRKHQEEQLLNTKRRKEDGVMETGNTSRPTTSRTRKPRQPKSSVVAPPEVFLPSNGNMEADFFSSLASLRRYADMKKKSKRSIINMEQIIKQCVEFNDRLDKEMQTVYSLCEQIARLQNEADTLEKRIEKDCLNKNAGD